MKRKERYIEINVKKLQMIGFVMPVVSLPLTSDFAKYKRFLFMHRVCLSALRSSLEDFAAH
jgi:hypothetical protein